MLGISGGIEPIYANYYERKTESLHGEDVYYRVYTKIVKDFMEEHKVSDERLLPDYFVTAMTLDYHQRIDMQSIWQRHIDASISSTAVSYTHLNVTFRHLYVSFKSWTLYVCFWKIIYG